MVDAKLSALTRTKINRDFAVKWVPLETDWRKFC